MCPLSSHKSGCFLIVITLVSCMLILLFSFTKSQESFPSFLRYHSSSLKCVHASWINHSVLLQIKKFLISTSHKIDSIVYNCAHVRTKTNSSSTISTFTCVICQTGYSNTISFMSQKASVCSKIELPNFRHWFQIETPIFLRFILIF